MPYVGRKLSEDDEPQTTLVYPWAAWAVAKIREALQAGAEPPTFKRTSPWSWIYLSSVVDRDDELRERARIDLHERRVEWL